jgi:hypothetical protein
VNLDDPIVLIHFVNDSVLVDTQAKAAGKLPYQELSYQGVSSDRLDSGFDDRLDLRRLEKRRTR